MDLFFVVKDIEIASCADGITPFIVENNIDNVIVPLEQACDALFAVFPLISARPQISAAL